MAQQHLCYEQCQYNLVNRYHQRLFALYSLVELLFDSCELSAILTYPKALQCFSPAESDDA
jgi:hypothetical protein